MNKKKQFGSTKLIDVAFLFASPIRMNKMQVPPITFHTELNNIKRVFKRTGRGIKFHSSLATR